MAKKTKKEEYEKDYEYAMAHPQEGIECGKHRMVYYHPVLGCPYCGKNASPQENKSKCGRCLDIYDINIQHTCIPSGNSLISASPRDKVEARDSKGNYYPSPQENKDWEEEFDMGGQFIDFEGDFRPNPHTKDELINFIRTQIDKVSKEAYNKGYEEAKRTI